MAKPRSNDLSLPPISPAAPGPLYQQVVDSIKREIEAGRIKPGASLPSFRSLAEQLLVSVITVRRAYEELEREGLIYRKQGVGTFVSEDAASLSQTLRRQEAEDFFALCGGSGDRCGIELGGSRAIRKSKTW